MSLLEDLEAVEPGYSGISEWSVLDEVDDVELVSTEDTGSGRWETYHTSVFRRGDEYVALDWSAPATEMQEGQDQSMAEFYPVKPRTEVITVTRYDRVEDEIPSLPEVAPDWAI